MVLALVVLSLWVATLLRSHVRYLIYIIIHNRSKITVLKQQWNNVMAGHHHSMKNCIKGPQHDEGWEAQL